MKFASITLGMAVLMAPSNGLLRASIRKQEIMMLQDAQMQPAEKQKLELQAELSNEAHTTELLREQLKSELVAADDGSIVRVDDATIVRADDSAPQSPELLREEVKDKFVAVHQHLHPQHLMRDSAMEAADEAQADADEAHADELLHEQLQEQNHLTSSNTTEASLQRDDALSPQEQKQKQLTEEQTRQLFEGAVPVNPGRDDALSPQEQKQKQLTEEQTRQLFEEAVPVNPGIEQKSTKAPSQEHKRLWSGLSRATKVSKQTQKQMEAQLRAFDQPLGVSVTLRSRRSLSSSSM